MNKSILTGLLALGLVGAASAAPLTFDFKDPKSVNTIQFKLDAPLEPISGSTNGISGSITFDAANPEATSGKIVVATKSLTVPNTMMGEHLQGAMWLDGANNAEIVFEIAKLSDVKATVANTWTGKATGKFTLKGVTKDVTVPVKLTFIADGLEKRTKPGNKGDLLVVRGDFSVLRSDYGINSGKMEDKVANEIALSVAIVGSAPKS